MTCGFATTPASHAVAGTGVSPLGEGLDVELDEVVPQATATDKSPPRAAESSAWLASEPWSIFDTGRTIAREVGADTRVAIEPLQPAPAPW